MKKVLIVEDDAILAFVHQKYVEQIGYEVIGCVATGTEAIEMTRTNHPDFILMDVLILGELDGIQAMAEIRRFSEVPVVYITGNSDPLIKQRAATTPGPADFLTKPINTEVLQSALNKFA